MNSPSAFIVESKKGELDQIRKTKMKGHAIRSQAQYLVEDEKQTKYFCSLENKNC